MNIKLQRQKRRKTKVRSKARGTALRPRLSVFRSNRFFYAQIIDDEKATTLVSVNEKELKEKVKSEDKLKLLGGLLAKKARAKKISKVVFDRGGYKYHGRVKKFAEAVREGGLKF